MVLLVEITVEFCAFETHMTEGSEQYLFVGVVYLEVDVPDPFDVNVTTMSGTAQCNSVKSFSTFWSKCTLCKTTAPLDYELESTILTIRPRDYYAVKVDVERDGIVEGWENFFIIFDFVDINDGDIFSLSFNKIEVFIEDCDGKWS